MNNPIYLNYLGHKVSINPDKDTLIYQSAKNPPFMKDRELVGIDLYIRKTDTTNFFYAIKWDLTKEKPYTYYLLTKDQTKSLVQKIKEMDYLGQTSHPSFSIKVKNYQIISKE